MSLRVRASRQGIRLPGEIVKIPECFQQKQIRCEREWHVEKCGFVMQGCRLEVFLSCALYD